MNNKICFLMGVGVGMIAGMMISRSHYAKLAQEEIDSVKEAYGKRKRNDDGYSANVVVVDELSEPTMEEYKDKLKECGYVTDEPYRDINEVYDPYVITPDEFGEKEDEGYSTISMTYYACGTLTDDANHPMTKREIEDVIGKDSLDHFGEHEDDSLHVRNDRMKCDFEILADPRTYEEVLEATPHLRRELEEET